MPTRTSHHFTLRSLAERARGGASDTVLQIMCGFELMERLHRLGVRRGGHRRGTLYKVRPKMPALTRLYAGIADDTARNWMNIAKEAAHRVWKKPVKTRPSEWTALERDEVVR